MSTTPDGAKRGAKGGATIYDIAELAGVSPSTVSRALSRPGRISAKTERRIRDAAEKLHYVANPMARALLTGRTNTVGLVVADITNPMFFDVLRGAQGAALARDYTVVLAESAESAQTERVAADRFARITDGVVLATSRLSDDEIVELSLRGPVVVINRKVEGVRSIVADNTNGIAEAVRHLVGLGHSSIAYVAGPDLSWMSGNRWEALEARCRWSNIQSQRIGPFPPTLDGGRQAAEAVRASGATAAIAFNDLMAIGLMSEYFAANLSVPGDLSIIGFDGIFGSDFTTPPLTTIVSPLKELGALALESLVHEIDPSAPEAPERELTTQLLLRGTTGPLR